VKDLQDYFYKKIEANKYFDRWISNEKKEYFLVCDKKLRKEKLNILKCINSNLKIKNKKVLEIGCFVGDLLFYLKKNFNCKVEGIEASKKACNLSNKIFKLKLENRIFLESKFFKLEKKNFKKFDLIICDDVLSWMDRKFILQTLSSIDYLLKEEGYLFLRDFCPKKNFSFKNHHYPNKHIYNFKQKNGHKEFFLLSGRYKLKYEKVFNSEKYQRVKVKFKQANIWSYSILQKQGSFTHPIKRFDGKK